jgi:hypothetical protein
MKGFISITAIVFFTIGSGPIAPVQSRDERIVSDLMSRLDMAPPHNKNTWLGDASKVPPSASDSDTVEESAGSFLGLLSTGTDEISSPVSSTDGQARAGAALDFLGILGVGVRTATTTEPSSPVYAVSRWASDLDALLDAQGLSGTYTVYVDGKCLISASRTTGPGVSYRFKPGCKIAGTNRATLTIDSPSNVIADAGRQIFGLGITIRFAGPGTVYPGWWGAKGNGSTDDTAAIQAVIDAVGGGTVLLPAGTYIADGLQVDSGTTLRGEGDATLKLKDYAADGMLSITGQNNIAIENLTFDMNGTNQGDPAVPITKPGIHATQMNYLQITNCRFIHLFEYAVSLYRCNRISIEDCHFSGKVEGNPTEWALKDIHAGTCTYLAVQDCTFDHEPPIDLHHGVVAIFLSGVSQCTLDGNFLRYCGADNICHHRGAAIDLYHNNHNVVITGNTLEECTNMGCRISRSKDIRFEGNSVGITDGGRECTVEICASPTYRTERVWIAGNVLKTAATDGEGVLITGPDAANSEPNKIYVLDNTMEGWYGVRVTTGCCDLQISGNTITTRYPCVRLERGTSAALCGVVVADNHLEMTPYVNQYALKARGEDIEICGNMITNAYRGMNLQIASGGYVHHNTIETTSYHVLLYNECQNLFLNANELIGTGRKYYRQGNELVFYDCSPPTP